MRLKSLTVQRKNILPVASLIESNRLPSEPASRDVDKFILTVSGGLCTANRIFALTALHVASASKVAARSSLAWLPN